MQFPTNSSVVYILRNYFLRKFCLLNLHFPKFVELIIFTNTITTTEFI